MRCVCARMSWVPSPKPWSLCFSNLYYLFFSRAYRTSLDSVGVFPFFFLSFPFRLQAKKEKNLKNARGRQDLSFRHHLCKENNRCTQQQQHDKTLRHTHKFFLFKSRIILGDLVCLLRPESALTRRQQSKSMMASMELMEIH